MNDNNNKEFAEFTGLAERLGRADLSGESRVKNALKERLLAKAERRSSRSPFVWLLPAAALAAALLIMFRPGPGPARPGYVFYASYGLSDDGYDQCGRQGLGDYLADSRF